MQRDQRNLGEAVRHRAVCANPPSELESTDFPTAVLVGLRQHLGDDLQFRRIDLRNQRTRKWLCSGRESSQRLLIKRLGKEEAREAQVFERVLQSCSLSAPRFLGAVEEAGWTWLMIEFIDGCAPVTERDFADLAIALSALHRDQKALALLATELQVPEAPTRYASIGARSLRSLKVLSDSGIINESTRDKSRRLIGRTDWLAEATWLASGRQVPVHGNVHLGNTVVRQIASPGSSQVVLIDWPDMMLGSPLEDLGTLAADAPGRMDLIRNAYREAGGGSIDASDLRRAFRFQLFVEVAWRAARLVLKSAEAFEIREFHARASLFGI
jgi:aminoglycoside phosphotransferase (APT) family kinase protein